MRLNVAVVGLLPPPPPPTGCWAMPAQLNQGCLKDTCWLHTKLTLEDPWDVSRNLLGSPVKRQTLLHSWSSDESVGKHTRAVIEPPKSKAWVFFSDLPPPPPRPPHPPNAMGSPVVAAAMSVPDGQILHHLPSLYALAFFSRCSSGCQSWREMVMTGIGSVLAS